MKTLLSSRILGIALILILIQSCSKDDGNTIIGEWNLKSINSECSQGNLNEEFEISQSNDMCCITLSTTEISDSIKLTLTITTCQKLVFKSDTEFEIINENNSIRDTSFFSYELIDHNIEVCPIANQCINYKVIDNKIELNVPMTTQSSGLSCNRKFVYTKQN